MWRAAVALLAAELFVEVVRTVAVDHHMGVDTIALVAMVGALALGEELAGVVVGLMFSGGAALEDAASSRARRELTALVQRAPKLARLRIGDRLAQVPVERVEIGDIVLVGTGEVIPVDGTLESGEAVIDTSTLTGEPLPVTVSRGMSVLSGTANAGAPFEVTADRAAVESAYAALVRLVEQAQAHRAPFMRMADRYAGFFLIEAGELLRLAASVDQLSAHVLGKALVRAAREAGQTLTTPSGVREEPGQGIKGFLDGRNVAVGSRAFLRSVGLPEAEVALVVALSGYGSAEAHVLVAVNGHLGGVIVMADELRPDADQIVPRLRAEGIRHIAMVSGDRRSVAERVGRELGVDRVYAEQSPEEKLEVVRSLRERDDLRPVIMVGDGINDAPALALADLGSRWEPPEPPSHQKPPTQSSPSTGSTASRRPCTPGAEPSSSHAKACSPAWASASPPWASQPAATSHPSPARCSKKPSTSR